MATDVKLVFGADAGSYSQIESDLAKQLAKLDGKLKVKVGLELSPKSKSELKQALGAALGDVSSAGHSGKASKRLVTPRQLEGVTKAAKGASTEINNVGTAIDKTAKTAKKHVKVSKQMTEEVKNLVDADKDAAKEEIKFQRSLKRGEILRKRVSQVQHQMVEGGMSRKSPVYKALGEYESRIDRLMHGLTKGTLPIGNFDAELSKIDTDVTKRANSITAHLKKIGSAAKNIKLGNIFSKKKNDTLRANEEIYRKMRAFEATAPKENQGSLGDLSSSLNSANKELEKGTISMDKYEARVSKIIRSYSSLGHRVAESMGLIKKQNKEAFDNDSLLKKIETKKNELKKLEITQGDTVGYKKNKETFEEASNQLDILSKGMAKGTITGEACKKTFAGIADNVNVAKSSLEKYNAEEKVKQAEEKDFARGVKEDLRLETKKNKLLTQHDTHLDKMRKFEQSLEGNVGKYSMEMLKGMSGEMEALGKSLSDGSIDIDTYTKQLSELEKRYTGIGRALKEYSDIQKKTTADKINGNNALENAELKLNDLDMLKSKYGDTAGYKAVSKELDGARSEIVNINKEFKNGEISLDEYNSKIAAVSQSIKMLTSDMKTLNASEDASKKEILSKLDIEKANKDIDASIAKMKDYTTKYQNTGGFEKQKETFASIATSMESLKSRLNSGEIGIQEFRREFQMLTQDLNAAKAAMDSFNKETEEQSKAAAKLEQAQKKIAPLLKKVNDAKKNWSGAIGGKSEADYLKLFDLSDQLLAIQDRRNQGLFDATDAQKLDMIASEFDRIDGSVHAAGEGVKSFGQSFKSLIQSYGQSFMLSQAVALMVSGIKQMVNSTIDIDTAMTQLKIVTGATDYEMESFLGESTALAKELGKSITDVAGSIEVFSRLGYSLDESSILSKYATIMSNVAGVSTDESTKGLTSIIKGFGLGVDQAEHVSDVLIEVGQKYAVSAGELMEAFERSGAALNASNTSFEKSAGLIAAANAAVQNSSTVGTALKTVSARIRGSKTDLEALGEDTSELADGFSKYAEELKNLTGKSILVEGTTNQFKDLYDIFSDISQVWDSLSDTSQARVAEILGGTRQLQVITSILSNWKDASGAYQAAMHSEGVAAKAEAQYMESVMGHVGEFRATFQELSSTFVSGDFLVDIIDLGTGLLNILTIITKITNALGGLKTVATVTAGAALSINMGSIVTQGSKIVSGIGKVYKSMKALSGLSMASKFTSIKEEILTTPNLLTKSLSGVTIAATAALTVYQIISQKLEEERQKAEAAAKEFTQSVKSIEDYKAEAISLREAIDGGTLSREEEISARERLLSIQEECIATYGAEASGMDLLSDSIDGVSDSFDRLTEAQAKSFLASNKTEIDRAIKNIDKERKYILGGIVDGDDISEPTEKFNKEISKLADSYDNITILDGGQIRFTGDVIEARKQLVGFAADLRDLQRSYGINSAQGYAVGLMLGNIDVALDEADELYSKWGTTYNTAVEAKIADSAGAADATRDYASAMIEVEKAQDAYNKVLLATDAKDRANAMKEFTQASEDALRVVEKLQYSDQDAGIERYINDAVDSFSGFGKAVNALQDENILNALKSVFDYTGGNADTVKSIIETPELIGDNVKYMAREVETLETELNTLSKLGNVDLFKRAQKDHRISVNGSNYNTIKGWGLDASIGDYMTVASQTFLDEKRKAAIVVTPILDNGQLLSQSALEKYISDVINSSPNGDYLKNDKYGIIMGVFDDDKNSLEKNLKLSDEFANKVHNIHSAIKDLEDMPFISKAIKVISDLLEKVGIDVDDLLSAFGFSNASENIDVITQSVAELGVELDGAKNSLQEFQDAMAGGEKDDVAKQYGDIYKRFAEDWASGKHGSNTVRAAIELFIPPEVLESVGYDLEKAGKVLSSDLYKSIFAVGKGQAADYGKNFFNYIKDKTDLVKQGIVEIREIASEDGKAGYTFGYSSLSELADGLGMTEDAVSSLLSALDMYGVQVMMSATETAQLADSIGLAAGTVVNSEAGIRNVIQSLADLGHDAIDIQSLLQTLQSAGYINMEAVGAETVANMISEVVAQQESVDKEPEIEFTTNANEAISECDAVGRRADAAAGSREIKFRITTTGRMPSILNRGGSAGGAIDKGIGKLVHGHASGTKNAPGGKTLLNEEGPELVSENGKAYVINDGKPGFANLSKGAIVLDADETEQAFKSVDRSSRKYKALAWGTKKKSSAKGAILDGLNKLVNKPTPVPNRTPKPVTKPVNNPYDYCPMCHSMIGKGATHCPYCGWRKSAGQVVEDSLSNAYEGSYGGSSSSWKDTIQSFEDSINSGYEEDFNDTAIIFPEDTYGSGGGGSGGGGSGGGYGGSDGYGGRDNSDRDNWFTKQYEEHNHLRNMDKESLKDYLDWLEDAYKKAYGEGLFEIEEFHKYEEEVYKGQQELFDDYLHDKEFQADQLEKQGADAGDIVNIYNQLIADIDKQIQEARDRGLNDNDEYIQNLINQQWNYRDTIKDLQEDASKDSKNNLEDLIEYRIKMLKQYLENEKEALEKRLDYLREFYGKQKDMLQESYDHEKYLDEQKEKRKSVNDVKFELDQLKYDDSAWAQKRKLELQEQLNSSEKELNDFEKAHALDTAKDDLDKLYEKQEDEINKKIEEIEKKLNDPKGLYDQALKDVQNNSMALYNEMIEFNNKYGTGIKEDIVDMWEEAYVSLKKYYELFNEYYKDINLINATGYVSNQVTKPRGPGQYAMGTRHATPGLHRVDELGAEYLFTSSNGNKYRMFSGGEKILSARGTNFLFDLAESGGAILDNILKSSTNTSGLYGLNKQTILGDIRMGDIIIQGNANAQTVSEIRRAQREGIEMVLSKINKLNK